MQCQSYRWVIVVCFQFSIRSYSSRLNIRLSAFIPQNVFRFWGQNNIKTGKSQNVFARIMGKFKNLTISQETKDLVRDLSLSSDEIADARTKYILGYKHIGSAWSAEYLRAKDAPRVFSARYCSAYTSTDRAWSSKSSVARAACALVSWRCSDRAAHYRRNHKYYTYNSLQFCSLLIKSKIATNDCTGREVISSVCPYFPDILWRFPTALRSFHD